MTLVRQGIAVSWITVSFLILWAGLQAWTGFNVLSAEHYTMLWRAYLNNFVFDTPERVALLVWPMVLCAWLWATMRKIPVHIIADSLVKEALRKRSPSPSPQGLIVPAHPNAANDQQDQASAAVKIPTSVSTIAGPVAVHVPSSSETASSNPGPTSVAALAVPANQSPTPQAKPNTVLHVPKPLTVADLDTLMQFASPEERTVIERALQQSKIGGPAVAEMIGAALDADSSSKNVGRPVPTDTLPEQKQDLPISEDQSAEADVPGIPAPVPPGRLLSAPSMLSPIGAIQLTVAETILTADIGAGWFTEGGLLLAVGVKLDQLSMAATMAKTMDALADSISRFLESEMPEDHPLFDAATILLINGDEEDAFAIESDLKGSSTRVMPMSGLEEELVLRYGVMHPSIPDSVQKVLSSLLEDLGAV